MKDLVISFYMLKELFFLVLGVKRCDKRICTPLLVGRFKLYFTYLILPNIQTQCSAVTHILWFRTWWSVEKDMVGIWAPMLVTTFPCLLFGVVQLYKVMALNSWQNNKNSPTMKAQRVNAHSNIDGQSKGVIRILDWGWPTRRSCIYNLVKTENK